MGDAEPSMQLGDLHSVASCPARLLTRRGFVALAAAASVGAVLSGCSETDSGQDEHTRQGLSSYAEVKDYPVSLKVYADANLRYFAAPGFDEFPTRLHRYAARYQELPDRENVSIEFVFVDPVELLEAAQAGFPDGDGLIARSDILSIGNDAGSVDGREDGYLIRDLAYYFKERCVMVRALGSDAMLPTAPTIDGEDLSDGTINRLQQLPAYDGVVALADPAAATEGICANGALAKQGFYSDSDGKSGYYAENVASKLRMYPTQDAAMEAVANGRCQMGFALKEAFEERYSGVEQCYDPPGGGVSYSAAALTCAAEAGVMRDFIESIFLYSD